MFGWILFGLNLALGALLFWYIREMLNKFHYIGDSTEDIHQRLEEFEQHLGAVYELETLYGDETLAGLLVHAKETKEYMQEYREIFRIEKAEEEEEGTPVDEQIEVSHD